VLAGDDSSLWTCGYALCVRVCSGFVTEVNAFGYEGTYAAYKFGDPWLQGMLKVDSHIARGSTGGP
jgi:hypothetical protein